MQQINICINNKPVSVSKSQTILEAALENDIYIPHLCYHRDLLPAGMCRLCGVEIDGVGGIPMACTTLVSEGMVIRTDSEAVEKTRREVLNLILADHDLGCMTCQANTDCELQKVANYIGVDQEKLDRYHKREEKLPIDSSNPFFSYDPNKCITCGICVRTCAEIQGLQAIDYINRGYKTIIGTFGQTSWADSNCESCGECVERCPVGALTPKNQVVPAYEVQTVCSYCGVGCSFFLGVRGEKIVSVRGNPEGPANQGQLCVKGRYGFNFINHPDRLTKPLIKHDGEFIEVEWERAYDFIAERLKETQGERFATFSSARCTNEDNYVIQKFTRAVMKSNSVDHCARL